MYVLINAIISSCAHTHTHTQTQKNASTPRSSSTSTAHTRRHSRKQPAPRRLRQGTLALREIRHYQKTTMLLLRRAPFARLVREVLVETHPTGPGFRWQVGAIECLQEASEAYLIHFMSDAYLCSLHAKRVTLMKQDFFLIKRLRHTQL